MEDRENNSSTEYSAKFRQGNLKIYTSLMLNARTHFQNRSVSSRMFGYEPGTEERPNIQVIIAHTHSAWNYHKRFIVNGSRGGFSTDQWLYCSRLGANVQVSGQNVPTFQVIYQSEQIGKLTEGWTDFELKGGKLT